MGYLATKTKAANQGSKSRGSFANLYAIYVLVEDYVAKGFASRGDYAEYEGAKFSDLLLRQRQLPFGEKLQNHALNGRLNDEFHKFYPTIDSRPILRDMKTQRYWINDALIRFEGESLASAIIEIIDAYVESRRGSFTAFIADARKIEALSPDGASEQREFVRSLLQPTTDARIFEIVSFAIMKAHYSSRSVWFGLTREDVEEQALVLYKTGRTNANDGGIDFVMRPVGRFFQVTESLDLKKYFLDLEKVQKFPMTFVIKSERTVDEITDYLRAGAQASFGVTALVDQYMEAVEEVVNIPTLHAYLDAVLDEGKAADLIGEIILQSRVEFNLSDDEEAIFKTEQ